MKIQKSYESFRLDNPNKFISVYANSLNTIMLCEQDKTIDTFFYTKRVEVNLSDLWEYIIALKSTTDKNKKDLMVKVIDILSKFENEKEVQYFV